MPDHPPSTTPRPDDRRSPLLVAGPDWNVVVAELGANEAQRHFDIRGRFDDLIEEPFPDVTAAAGDLANTAEGVWVIVDTESEDDIGFLTFVVNPRRPPTRKESRPDALHHTAWLVPDWQGRGIGPKAITVAAEVMHER